MKKHYKMLLALIVLSAQIFTANAQRNGKMLFTARLSAKNEVPANASIAKGLVTVVVEGNTVTVNAVFDSLTGPVTACHFHKGIAGANGGTFTNFLTSVRGNRLYIKTTLTNAQIGDMIEDSVYINVHTAANAGGEIRGQLNFQSDILLNAFATGAQEVPAVSGTASALGTFVASQVLFNTGNRLEYKIVANGLTGPIVAAHLHYGARGASGGVAYPLTFSGNTLVGSLTVPFSFIDSLFNGLIYMNIHTAANSGGEIRGQIGYQGVGIGFDGIIESAQEVPTNASTAKGSMYANIRSTLDTLDYGVVVSGLTPTAAHFHNGAAGTNGGVVVNLTPAGAAYPNAYGGSIALTPALITALTKDSFYANFHTTANPSGEIRGQVLSLLRTGLVANLCGGQETPAVTTNASGAGYVSLEHNKRDFFLDAVTNGLSSNATGAHIHKGAKGAAGPVVVNLTSFLSGNAIAIQGQPGIAGSTSLFSTTFVDSIVNGLTYFNFHNAANPNGEIRGQLGADLVQECLANATFELNGEKFAVKIAPNPTSEQTSLIFNSNELFDAQIVVSDLAGRQITGKSAQILRGPNQVDVNLSGLNNGIYFIQMRQGNRLLFTEKIVKN
jgi:hypothetical protein